MLDAAGFAHAGSRDNDLASLVKVDRTRFLRGGHDLQIREGERIDPSIDQRPGLLVIAGHGIL